MSVHCDATGLYWSSSSEPRGKNLVSTRAAQIKHDYLMLENQSESWINEIMSLISMVDISVKLTRVGEPNNLYLNLARDDH